MKGIRSRIKEIRSLFLTVEDEKECLNVRMLKFSSCGIFLVFLFIEFLSTNDASLLGKSSKEMATTKAAIEGEVSISKKAADLISEDSPVRKTRRRSKRVTKINFGAKQVLKRGKIAGSGIPSGQSFIGQLLSGIDTRMRNQLVKVILPYGVRHRNGENIPKETLLLGTASYSGDGERVGLRFNKAVFPDGSEHKLEAQALSSEDYSPGIVGVHYSNTDIRMAAQVGLSVVSAAADVLTSRVNLGGFSGQMPEATMRNAALQGVAGSARNEAGIQAGKVNSEKGYVIVDAGSELIVSLTSMFTKGL